MKGKKVLSALETASNYFKDDAPYETIIFSFLRFFNYSFLILFVLAIITSRFTEEETTIKNSYLILIFFLSPILSLIIRHIIKKKHEFYIWDKVEREKREIFIDSISFFVYTFTFLSMFTFFNTLDSYIRIEKISDPEILSLSLGFFYSLLFIANAMFPVQLLYFMFKDELLQDNLIANKPQNWDLDSKKDSHYY
jgi:hypothetical protein